MNDDGVYAPGLAAMRQALLELGEVTVVAPQSAESGASHAISFGGPFHVSRVTINGEFPAYAVNGRPADCTKIALSRLLPDKPDLVVSGINDGANASSNVIYSGTIAAGAEGAFVNVPSFAVSLQRGGEPKFDQAAGITLKLITFLLEQRFDPGLLMSINIPTLSKGPPKGVRVARQGNIHILDRFERYEAPDGKDYFWRGGDFDHETDSPDSDLHAMSNGYVVITPLRFDLTAHEELARMRRWSYPGVT